MTRDSRFLDFSSKGWAVGGLLFFAALTVAFTMAARSVIMHLVVKPPLHSAATERAAIAQWPEVPATLFRLTLTEKRGGRGNGLTYTPTVQYCYKPVPIGTGHLRPGIGRLGEPG